MKSSVIKLGFSLTLCNVNQPIKIVLWLKVAKLIKSLLIRKLRKYLDKMFICCTKENILNEKIRKMGRSFHRTRSGCWDNDYLVLLFLSETNMCLIHTVNYSEKLTVRFKMNNQHLIKLTTSNWLSILKSIKVLIHSIGLYQSII